MKINIPAWRTNAAGSDYANIQQPLDIANALQGSPIKLLLDAGISELTIQTLAQVFWIAHLENNHQDMIARWNESKQLVDEINKYDSTKSNDFYKIVVTSWFMQEPFNTKFRESNAEKLPYISHTNDTILIDLFSQGRADLLSMKLDTHPRNMDIAKEYGVTPAAL